PARIPHEKSPGGDRGRNNAPAPHLSQGALRPILLGGAYSPAPRGTLMHAAKCPPPLSASGGTIFAQSASFSGWWHLGWKGQPGGGLAGEGTSPRSTIRSRLRPGSATGTADRSACVYGISG